MKSLCVIDDDPIVIFGLRRMLEYVTVKARLMSFNNGLEALEHLRPKFKLATEELPDVIFVDLNMPVMDGWGFIEAYTRELAPIVTTKPVLYIVSSSIDAQDHDRAAQLSEVSGFIIKPVSTSELEQILVAHNF